MISVPLRQRNGEMSEDQIPKGLMERLALVDSKLDKLLAHQTASEEERVSERLNLVEAKCRQEIGFTAWDDFDIPGDGGPASPLEDPLPFKTQVSAKEVDSIFQKVDKINRDAEVMVRVEKLEKQNRKIVILGSMFLTLVLLLAGASAFLMVQARFLNKGGVLQAEERVESPASTDGEGVAKAHDPQGPHVIAEHQAPPATEPPAKTLDPNPVAATVDPTPAKTVPVFKYVGSKTSNKYHYPGCKWAAEIKPQNLLHFSSTAEAHKRGYIPCPTCLPPSSDQGKTGH
jgi:hypothetical protein